MGSFSLIFGSLAGLNLRKGCSVALCGEHTRTHFYLIHTKEKPAISWTLGRRLELRVFSFFYERRHARRNC